MNNTEDTTKLAMRSSTEVPISRTDSNLQPGQRPEAIARTLSRSQQILQFFDSWPLQDTTEKVSRSFVCEGFSKFSLYLGIDSTGAPTTIQIKVQFLNPRTGKWYTYKQGPFTSLFYEDTDTANGIHEIFNGDCAGREMRITLTGVGTTSSAYFTVDADVEYYN